MPHVGVPLLEWKKRPEVHTVPQRPSRLMSWLPACLHAAGYGFWGCFCAFFHPYANEWWQWLVLLALCLSLLCPVVAFVWALVALLLGEARRRNAGVLGLSVLFPFVYLLMLNALS